MVIPMRAKGPTLRLTVVLGMALSVAAPARADEVLITGPGVIVTDADIRAEIASAPEPLRSQMTSARGRLAEAIDNVYRRRAMVAAAKEAGLDRSPEIQAQIERARDTVLAGAITERKQQELAARVPDMTARARDLYQARAERYLIPERVVARHILLRADAQEARTARRPEAEALLQRLRAGADFAALAKELSEDPGSAKNGGKLPPFPRGKMAKSFEDAAFALKQPGELSPVVESDFGLHLIQLEEIQPAGQRPFDAVKETIISKLRQDWVVEAQEAWRQGIVDPAKSKIDQPALDAFMDKTTGSQPATTAGRPSDPKGQ